MPIIIKCSHIKYLRSDMHNNLLIDIDSLDYYHFYMTNNYVKLLDEVPLNELKDYVTKREREESL